MRIARKEDDTKPRIAEKGEILYELMDRAEELGGTVKHSLVHIVIPMNKCSSAHFHTVSEETYYVLKGEGRMVIDDKVFTLVPGQACLIMPGEVHQIFNDKSTDLEFLAICAPAWEPGDSTYI